MKLGARWSHRVAIEWWLVALLSSAFILFLTHSHATKRLDDLAYDGLLHLQTHEPDARILLIVIDNRSLQEIGRWPWPRETHARLLNRIAAGHPKAIVYDVLFVEPEPGDVQLGRAVDRSGPVFLPLLLDGSSLDGTRFKPILPVLPIRHAASGIGHVNLSPDRDGVIRRVRLNETDGSGRWPHLMELVRRNVENTPSQESGAMLLPFAGPSGHFPTIGADAVLRGELPLELLRNRIVIVGATAPGLGDRYVVPLSDTNGGMSGVEIQANLLDGLLQGGGLAVEAGFAPRAFTALALLWLLLPALKRLRPRTTIIVLGGLVALTLVASGLVFHFFRLWIPPAPALAGLVLVYPLWSWRRLVGVSSFMTRELERLRSEPEVLPIRAEPIVPIDPVTREAMLLSDAVSKLRAMRRFVADSMDQLPDAVFVVDDAGSIALANRCAKELLDARPCGIDPPNVVALLQWLQPLNVCASGLWPPPSAGSRQEALGPDGRVFDVMFSEHLDVTSRQAGWIVRISDVSAIRTAQRQRDHMLHYLTHDMRSPQASILALTSNAETGEINTDLIQRIEHYARRTLALADGIVHLARAETLAYEPVLLNLADLLTGAVDELWPQIKKKGLSVELIGTDEDILVCGEPSLLARAFINLVDNAVKYSRSGRHLSGLLERAEVNGIPVANCLICDEGEGIAAERVTTLFERFQHGPAGTSTRGAGLGLAFVHTVVARHGGGIKCDSRIGLGTTFTITLPLASEASVEQPDRDPDSYLASVQGRSPG